MNLLLIFDLIFYSKSQYKLTSKFHTTVAQLLSHYKVLKTIINTLKTSISFPPGLSWSSYTCAVCITSNLRQRWHSSGGSGLVETRQTSWARTHVAQRVCACDFASFVLARTGTLFLRRRLSKSLNHVRRCMWFKKRFWLPQGVIMCLRVGTALLCPFIHSSAEPSGTLRSLQAHLSASQWLKHHKTSKASQINNVFPFLKSHDFLDSDSLPPAGQLHQNHCDLFLLSFLCHLVDEVKEFGF